MNLATEIFVSRLYSVEIPATDKISKGDVHKFIITLTYVCTYVCVYIYIYIYTQQQKIYIFFFLSLYILHSKLNFHYSIFLDFS